MGSNFNVRIHNKINDITIYQINQILIIINIILHQSCSRILCLTFHYQVLEWITGVYYLSKK